MRWPLPLCPRGHERARRLGPAMVAATAKVAGAREVGRTVGAVIKSLRRLIWRGAGRWREKNALRHAEKR
eukprot:3010428-Lingulodinium_polyedra.AAC.1